MPLIIQDRMFDTNGQLYFPAGVPFIPNPDHPFWVPEFLGDVICVNGKAWPFMNVEPKRYRSCSSMAPMPAPTKCLSPQARV